MTTIEPEDRDLFFTQQIAALNRQADIVSTTHRKWMSEVDPDPGTLMARLHKLARARAVIGEVMTNLADQRSHQTGDDWVMFRRTLRLDLPTGNFTNYQPGDVPNPITET